MNKYFKILELDKVLDMLALEASNEQTKTMIRETVPCNDFDTVKSEVNKALNAFDLSIKFGSPPFINFKNINNHLTRAKAGSRLSLKDLLEVANSLKQINMISNWHKHCSEMETDLDYLFSRVIPNNYLLDRLETSILSEEELSDAASSELASIRRKIAQSGLKLRSVLDKMIKSTTIQKYLQESIITMRDGRFVLPVKAEHKGDVQGLVHDTSATGQTLFIEPMSVVDANNDIRILKIKEQEEIDRIIVELTKLCADNSELLSDSIDSCVVLNYYFSKASLAIKMKANAPSITNDGVIKLNKARHPLIDKNSVVPINIELGENYQALIITGPNTGGKTVALKTAGLLTSMVMCGLLIPVADGSQVSVFENILVDIGDNQSIEQSLSTFSAHTNRIIEILKTANNESLVLIDELGSGTDPIEGAALAVAIIDKLIEKNAKLMITTHYQELKLYAIEKKEAENASCEIDIDTLKPTYRLLTGSPGKSNAFIISSNLGMEKGIIEKAKQLVSEENLRFESVIEKLEASRKELDKKNEEISKIKREIKETEEKLKKELEEFEKNKNIEYEKVRLSALSIIEQTKEISNELLDELKLIKKEKDKDSFHNSLSSAEGKVRQSLNKMYDTSNPVTEKKNDNYKLPRKLKNGDNVLVVTLDKKGIVSGEEDSSGNIFVQLGIMRTRVNINDLRLLEKEKVTFNNSKVVQKKSTNTSRLNAKVEQELDIRGYSSDDGIYEMDLFLNNAILTGIHMVTIIHGKGTGVLRKAVHKRLSEISIVKNYRLGVFGEGEDGVTVVELK